MIPLRIKFVVTQNTKFVITAQGKDILEILFFFTWKIAQFAIQVLNIRICQKFHPKNIYCNLKGT